MARDLLRDAVEVTVEGADQAPAIRHLFCEVEPAHRQKALAGLLLTLSDSLPVLIAGIVLFTRWPRRCTCWCTTWGPACWAPGAGISGPPANGRAWRRWPAACLRWRL
ncbi:hypothetical protein G6F58_013351 [Rhizopus delemar]|nr:hypothetical protein G6F58_013351 [Rhizopus delemar]